MTALETDTCHVVLAASESAARDARRQLAGYLCGAAVREAAIADVEVVVSELVTNAVRHAARGPDATVEVAWSLLHRRLRLQVSDMGRPTRRPLHEHTAVGGRGLSIVAALAETWSLVHADRGTTVTASIRVA